MNNRLYVANLAHDTSQEDLRVLFAGAGEVREVAIPTDREASHVRFAFVTMADAAAATAAIAQLDGAELGGCALRVKEAPERVQRRGAGDGRSRYRYRLPGAEARPLQLQGVDLKTAALLLASVDSAKAAITRAEDELHSAIREVRVAPRAEKVAIGVALARAFANLQEAKGELGALEAQLASDRVPASGHDA